MAERADDRLVRLLGLVAFLDGAGGVPVSVLADRFGVSERQILADVDALWVSGTPGYWPDDLIDFDADSFERGVVRLTQARGMTRPLRLAPREAIALIAALRALSGSLAVAEDEVRAATVSSVLSKLTEAAGVAVAAVDVQLAQEGDAEVVGAVRRALQENRRMRIRYVSASDVTSVRDVDPASLHSQDSCAYMVAWCYRAGASRRFRLDRVVHAEVLDVLADDHDMSGRVDFVPMPDAPLVTIRLASPARSVAELVPTEDVRDLPDGSFEMDVRVTNPVWLRQMLLVQAEHVLAVEPPEVVLDVSRAAQSALRAYESVR